MAKKKKKQKVRKPLSLSSVKKTFNNTLEKEFQVEPEAIENLRDTLIEIAEIIAIDSEKMAISKGTKRITAKDVHDATMIWLERGE